MGIAKLKVEETEDSGLAATMARLEALAAEMGEQPETDGPSPTIEQALRLLGIELPDESA